MTRRPAKPRITKPNLKWVFQRGRWIPKFRVTWTENGVRKERAITLDWKNDPERLDALYWECKSGRHEKQAKPAQYTWGEAILKWRTDPRIQGRLSAGTKKSYRSSLEMILEANAAKDMRRTTRAGLRAAHDALAGTPRKADKLLAVSSLIWNYAANELDWPIGDNPAAKIRHYGRQREFEPWPDWMIKALTTAPDKVRIASELILGTGQRPAAAIGMRRDAFQGETMRLIDEKADETFEVHCPERLRDFVNSIPNRGQFILAKNLTEPLGYDSIEREFREWRKGLGEKAAPYSLHGLRKCAILELVYAGWTDAEIQSVTNQSMQMIAYYRRRANRKILSRNAARRAAKRNGNET